MSKCKACGAEVIWIRTLKGKNMICDKEPVMYWGKKGSKQKVITKNGEVLSCVFEGDPQQATGIGFIPHWSTCPSANNFRKRMPSAKGMRNL